jgi:hypothetical protein
MRGGGGGRGGRSGEDFLYVFKGAPSARHAYGRNRLRELARATGGEQNGRVTSDKRQGSPGVSPSLGGSFRRALRAEALRRDELPRMAAPAPARNRSPPSRPDAVPHEQGQAVTLAPSAPIAVERSQPPGRNAAHCPGRPLQRQGHPKILSNRFAERIFGTRP